jgi:pyruvate, water dikinase
MNAGSFRVQMAGRGRHNSCMDVPRCVVSFAEIGIADVPSVGGKNASLGEMIRELGALGVRVPGGFAITAEAFWWHLRCAGLTDWIYGRLDDTDIADAAALAVTGAAIRERVAAAPLPTPLLEQIVEAYKALSATARANGGTQRGTQRSAPAWVDVAVRSSATAEDLPTASFAGQHETFLNIRGPEALDAAVRGCMASLFTDRAIVYRVANKFDHRAVALSVGVQVMVRSDAGPDGCAGTMFTLDTESGFRGVVMIDASWGLGETVVQGRVSPDEYWVHKATARAGFQAVIRRELGDKAVKLVYACEGRTAARSVKEVPVPAADRARFALTSDEALTLARWAMQVEEHYSKKAGAGVPMDLEWGKDGRSGELFVLQARPETVHSQRATGTRLEVFRLKGAAGRVIVEGKSVGSRVGSGPARIVRSTADLPKFKDGEVLVAAMTDPDWEPVLRKAAAVVTDRGGRTCHAAIVSREMGLPCVVGTGTATEILRDGQVVTVSCAGEGMGGDVGKVYDGAVPFAREELDGVAADAACAADAQPGGPRQCVSARPVARVGGVGRGVDADRVPGVELDRRASDGAGASGARGRREGAGGDSGAGGSVRVAAGVLCLAAGRGRRADRRGVPPAPGHRALQRLQDQRVREPDGGRGL